MAEQVALRNFLSELYGWDWVVGDERLARYAVATLEGAPVMGLTVAPDDVTHPVTFFATNDTQASVERARALGGLVVRGPDHVVDLGWSTILTDPTGARHGLWEPESFSGFGRAYEANAPGWFDHVSTNGDRAARYYCGLSGHAIIEPEPRMRILHHDGVWFASITQPQVVEEQPRWNPVYVVDELDRTRRVVRHHGGQVLVEEMPVPGSAISVFRDPVVGSVMTVMAAGAAAG